MRVPYLADTDHLNYPFGVWAGSGNVWIGESSGRRALQFTSVGAYLSAIGAAGVRWYQDQEIVWLGDVAVDSAGNTWLADTWASHLLEFDASGNFLRELGEAWNGGSDDYHFIIPVSLAFDSAGNIYVSDGCGWGPLDSGNQRVQIFDPDANYLNTIGQTGVPGPGNDQFYAPCHIAIYADVLYVADSGNHRVQLFDVSSPLSPAYLATIGVTGEQGDDNAHLNEPTGVAVDASAIYVADSLNDRVQVFGRTTRAYQGTIGTGWGTGNDQFEQPTDVAVDGPLLYVADFVNTRVQQFSTTGVYQRTYGVTGVPYLTDGYHYNEPYGVAAAPDGGLYLVESAGERLLRLNADGTLAWAVGAPGVEGWHGVSTDFWLPSDVALDAAGRVYVASRGTFRVQIYNPDGSHFATLHDWSAGADWFDRPTGLALAPNGYLYVADAWRQRVAVFDASLAYVASLGVVDEAGSDNAHFNQPGDVAVDSDGTIYVADQANQRVQVFDASRNYVRTMGEAGVCDNDFDHFCWPTHLALDAAQRLYVADPGRARVQVFDQSGAYLTTVDGSWGTSPGHMWDAEGVAVDGEGTLYVPDGDNHRVQVFAPGYPGWVQTNINGFGGVALYVGTLDVFNSALYAGTWDGQVWRAPDGQTWTDVTPSWSSPAAFDAEVFGSYLYFGVGPAEDPGEVWRTDGTTWQQVVSGGFGDASNSGVNALHVFSGALYAATVNGDTGTEIWRSATGNPGDWTQVNQDGFGGGGTPQDQTMDVYNGYLYVGLNRSNAAELWRTPDGTTWTLVFTDGLAANIPTVSAMAEFGGQFYIGVRNVTTGGEVWRSGDGLNWTPVVTGGLGNPNNQRPYGLIVFDGRLYLVFCNTVTGAEVWRSADGSVWEKVADGGWGDSNNGFVDYYDKGAAVFANRLYIGTMNGITGGEIWKRTVTADFTASSVQGTPPLTVHFTNTSGGDYTTSPVPGVPPLTVHFANTSGGDYTTSLWDFGDGATSTETNPIHTYGGGVYDVSLTVGDGVDSNTRTRSGYIRALYPVYLPLVMRNH
jgi:hypothetical protein